MNTRICSLAGAIILLATTASSASALPVDDGIAGATHTVLGPCNQGKPPGFQLQSTIAFTSTRDHQSDMLSPQEGAEIYLAKPNSADPTQLTDVRQLTDNTFGDGFANLSPDGKRIVFDSDRLSGQFNVSDLFLMNADGSDQTFLTRGSSATWSPDCKEIAYHASASGTGLPTRTDPGAATSDSDIFVANVDDLLAGVAQPRDITNTPEKVDDDADWSPDGQQIAYTAHDFGDDIRNGAGFTSNSADIYIANADGTGPPRQLTTTPYEERAPAWSPDGTRIAYSCRIGGGFNVSQICVINADGTGFEQLTDDTVANLAPTWSPDGQKLLFNKILPAVVPRVQNYQLFTINSTLGPDGTKPTAREITCAPQQEPPTTYPYPCPSDVTPTSGINLFAHWGVLRVKG